MPWAFLIGSSAGAVWANRILLSLIGLLALIGVGRSDAGRRRPRARLLPMKSLVRPYFEALLLLLLGSGFLALAGTGRIGWPLTLAISAALLLRALLLWRGQSPRIPPQWVSIATVLYFGFYFADVYVLSADFIEATIHLVLFVAVVKLFSASQPRDYLYLCVLGFLELLAAATLTVSTAFLATFGIFLILTVATVVAYEMFRAEGAARIVARGERADYAMRVRGSLLSVSLGIAGSVAVCAAVIFFLLPRLTFSYWHPGYPDTQLTGFSDQVRLGDISKLQESDTVVMHVRPLDSTGTITLGAVAPAAGTGGLLWRGRALSNFDGRTWSNTSHSIVVRTYLGRVDFPLAVATPWPHNRLARFGVTLEPIGSDVLFAPQRIQELSTRFRNLGVDSTLTISSVGQQFSGISYSVVSDLSIPPDADLDPDRAALPDWVKSEYLELPSDLDPRIPALAKRIAGGLPTPVQQMRALADYLRTHYRYSLRHLPHGPDPLADFLFGTRSGHCEYFASALAVMGRTLGIPTRVVNGFVTGQYNDISGEYIIRGRDAHSWVEAYFPLERRSLRYRLAGVSQPSNLSDVDALARDSEVGRVGDPEHGSGVWLTFDGTAGDPEALAGRWSRAMLYFDAFESWWQEWVINYDFFHQITLAQHLQVQLQARSDRLRRLLHQSPQRWWNELKQALTATGGKLNRSSARDLPLILLLIASLILLLFARTSGLPLRLARFFARGADLKAWRSREAARQYRRLQRVLNSAGYRHEPFETADELVARVSSEQVRPAVADFVRHYQNARFGEQDRELMALPPSLREVRRSLNRVQGSRWWRRIQPARA
jgi:hypothetical protein